MDRLANYIFLFIILFLFILEGHIDDHFRILTALFLSFAVSVIAFFFDWLSLDGLYAATVLGIAVVGFGGWITGSLLVIFFISGSLLTIGTGDGPDRSSTGKEKSLTARRNGLQIWANGFWIVLVSILFFLTRDTDLLVVAAAAIASVTSDTWATELGRRAGGKTVLITDFKSIPPGTDGGISAMGTLGGLMGALLIAIFYLLFSGNFSAAHFIIITLSGFSGCLADSYIGAVYLKAEAAGGKRKRNRISGWICRLFNTPEMANNSINWLATAAGVLVSFLLIQLT